LVDGFHIELPVHCLDFDPASGFSKLAARKQFSRTQQVWAITSVLCKKKPSKILCEIAIQPQSAKMAGPNFYSEISELQKFSERIAD